MNIQVPIYAVMFLFSAAISTVVGYWILQMRNAPGSRYFGFAMMSVAIWTFFAAMEEVVVVPDLKILCSKLEYIGIVSTAPLLLSFALQYTGSNHFLSRRNMVLLWSIPFLTLLLALTNDFHRILWTSYTLTETAIGLVIRYGHGPYWYFYMAFNYVILMAVFLIIFIAGRKASKVYRSQMVGILIALTIPWVANIIYATRISPIPALDITPLAFSITGLIIAWTLYRFRLFELVPVARQVVVENMRDGVIVTDEENHIIDFNPSSMRLLGKEDFKIGKSITTLFSAWPDVIEKLISREEFQMELDPPDDLSKSLEIQITPIREMGTQQGRIMVIRDITQRRALEKAEKEQRQIAESLRETSAILNSTLDFNEVLDRILRTVSNVLPSDSGNIALINQSGIAEVVHQKGYETYHCEEIVKKIKLPIESTPTLSTIIKTGKPVIIPDVQNDPGWIRIKGMEWIRSYAAAPIRIHNKVEGFLRLDSAKLGFYQNTDSDRLQAFADQAALAIENSRLFEATQRTADELTILNNINIAITSGLDLDALLRTLFDQSSKIASIDCFYVSLYDEDTRQITMPLYYESGHFETGSARSILDLPGLTGYIIETRKTLHIADTLDPSLLPPVQVLHKGGKPTRSFVGVPLILRERVVGVISMQNYEPFAFTDDQIHLLELLSVQATIAIENARLFSRTQQMAITDSVTGLHNRRHFFTLASQEVERAVRYLRPLSVIMFDIDKFKQVNDTLGHFAGDQVLLAVASRCKHILRKIDIIGRYGGDEFVILLPESSLDAAVRAAERLQDGVRSSAIMIPEATVQITITQGVAVLDDENSTLDLLLEAADRALIEAKQEGRDLVRVFSKNTGKRM